MPCVGIANTVHNFRSSSRKWDVGGKSAQSFYEDGIRTAFAQPIGANNAKAGDATEYIQ